MPDDTPEFTIVGAGLAGTLLACYLGRAGRRVEVYERRSDPRWGVSPAGRSINLAISVRGIQALRQVGLAEDVLRAAIPMRGRMMHDRAGRLTFQPYGKDDGESINSLSRAGLNLALVKAAESYAGVRTIFDKRCTGFDPETGTLDLVDEVTGGTSRAPFRLLVGADGVHSAVRARMQALGRCESRLDALAYGYKELHIPPGPGDSFRMEKHALHIWPRRRFMMIALPNADGSFTCTVFWPLDGPGSFASLQTEADVRSYFEEQFPDAMPLMPTLAQDYQTNPVGQLVTVRCHPWHLDAKAVLLGDAAHAVVPFLGQGMNAAFEDCTVLADCLARHGADPAAALSEFEARRKLHTDTLAELCLENFVEMRDKVGSRTFLLRKKAENLLHKWFPTRCLPLYTMISFTTIPYADALKRAKRQDRIVAVALAGVAALAVALLVLLLRVAATR